MKVSHNDMQRQGRSVPVLPVSRRRCTRRKVLAGCQHQVPLPARQQLCVPKYFEKN